MRNKIILSIMLLIGVSQLYAQTELQNEFPLNPTSNSDYLLKEYLDYQWVDSNWTVSSKGTYSYDENNNPLENYSFVWRDSAFVKLYGYYFTYSGNNLIEFIIRTFTETGYYNNIRDLNVYDGNNNIIESVDQRWLDSSWVNSSKQLFVYDNHNTLTETTYYYWDGSKWETQNKTTYTYDQNNNQIEALRQQLTNGIQWVNYSRNVYVYDVNNNLIENLYQNWNDGNWSDDNKLSYMYDGNNNKIQELYEYVIGLKWSNSSRYSYTYDGNNNLIEHIFQFWENSTWNNVQKRNFTYVQITGIESETNAIPKVFSLSQNYPNPFNPTTTIKFSLPEQGLVDLRVYNILGQEVSTLVNKELTAGYHEVSFGFNNIPSGVYVYRMNVKGKFNSVKKMLMIK